MTIAAIPNTVSWLQENPSFDGCSSPYRRQNNFDFAEVVEPSRLVLPPELDPIVLVFRRRSLQLP